MCVLSLVRHIWLCDPTDCSPPSSSVHTEENTGVVCHALFQGIFSPQNRTHVSYVCYIAGGSFTSWAVREAWGPEVGNQLTKLHLNKKMVSSLLCLGLYMPKSPVFEWVTESSSVMSDSLPPMDYTIHGVLQARIPEWVAFPFSRGSSQPRDRTQVSHIAGRFFTSWATR